MPAREKLNAATIHGVMAVAGLTALVFQSWPVFWISAAVMAATAIHSGDIRLTKTGGRRGKR